MHTITTGVKVTVFLFALFLLPINGYTQYVGGEVGVNFAIGSPQGEFSENVENLGLGGSFYGGYNLPKSPFMIGVDIGYLRYGKESRLEPFSLTIPDVTVRVENTNNILLTHLFIRVQPDLGSVKPYLDGLVGLKRLYTKTKIESDEFDDDEPIAESTNSSDYALSYGIGGGLKIKVFEKSVSAEKSGSVAIYIDLGVRYLLGGEAEYLKKGSITRTTTGDVIYDFRQSKTDLLLFNIGVSLLF